MSYFYAVWRRGMLAALLPVAALAQAPTLTARLPAVSTITAPRTTPVELTFSAPMSAQTAAADAVRVVSSWRGLLPGTYSGGGTSTITFTPNRYFLPGEPVTVGVTTRATSLSSGTAVVPTQYQFAIQPPGGNGHFGTDVETVGVGTRPFSVAVGDVNGDGKLDFVTADSGTNTASVRLGDGQGGFSGTTAVGVGTSPVA